MIDSYSYWHYVLLNGYIDIPIEKIMIYLHYALIILRIERGVYMDSDDINFNAAIFPYKIMMLVSLYISKLHGHFYNVKNSSY